MPKRAMKEKQELPSARACLQKAFCKMCVTIYGRFRPDEGAVAGYGNRIQAKYTAKWGVQKQGTSCAVPCLHFNPCYTVFQYFSKGNYSFNRLYSSIDLFISEAIFSTASSAVSLPFSMFSISVSTIERASGKTLRRAPAYSGAES